MIAFFLYSSATAQTQPEPNPVIITTFQFSDPPPGDTSFKNIKVDSLIDYYIDKGVRPNALIKNFRILRHWWGDDSYKVQAIYEIDKFENINKAEDKTDELINASFKNEADKNKFWRLWGKLFNRHEDNIMSDWGKPKM